MEVLDMSGSRWDEKEVAVEAEGEGCCVLEVVESSVSVSSLGDSARGFSDGAVVADRCLARMVRLIWLCENGRCGDDGKGCDHSSTVSRIAAVISS